jgi:hypothetical protein
MGTCSGSRRFSPAGFLHLPGQIISRHEFFGGWFSKKDPMPREDAFRAGRNRRLPEDPTRGTLKA